ncbi:hypothetical protein PCO82_03650 [Pectobacteriaceae bacterium CE90]|nr:hypothetical protein [Prodigiosinella sp. LS101]WJV53165.1 hypothetical protein PCO85_18585 [Prodigiosinella sp. LS101]WJV57524.1 hypothetical protein PCO84_18565 [Pectobacteriaceae bacterium C111]WJY15804.1 hypothetical protein PCO82_03650 [Pectobacteriaceae bacterium CE90]
MPVISLPLVLAGIERYSFRLVDIHLHIGSGVDYGQMMKSVSG